MGAKKKAGRLPREVLGVKLPKELRKAGNRLIEQAASPAGQQAIVGALSMAAAAAAAVAKGRDAAPSPSPSPSSSASQGATGPAEGTQRAPDPQVFVDGLEQLAEKALGRLFGGAR